jgi:calcium/calmodulin-dependent protein kinase (CaM kinase) II
MKMHAFFPVRFFGMYDDASCYYLVFELVTGGELFDEIVTRSFYNETDARYLHT